MKFKTKKLITTIAFLSCIFLSIVGLIIYTLQNAIMNDAQRNVYESTEMVQMKRGEKLAFADANEYFEEVKNRYGDSLQVHSQGAYDLSGGNTNSSQVSSMIYIDEDGYINAKKAGVYQLEYNFTVKVETDERESGYDVERYMSNSFTALVCVYEGDEDKFQPLPEDPSLIPSSYHDDKEYPNYIMTKDITWSLSRAVGVSTFYGTLINPNGYTLTWDISEESRENGKYQGYVNCLFFDNRGYIDGLKVKIVSDKENPIMKSDFYGLVENNYGVLQNCEIEGTVYLDNTEQNYSYSQPRFYALPQNGFTYNNAARMTVYSNGDIYAYKTDGRSDSDFSKRRWQSKNNKVYLDSWYYEDEVKAQRRVVETIEATERNSNTCEHLIYGKTGAEDKTITLQIPDVATKLGEKQYKMCYWRMPENAPLEIEQDCWNTIRWSYYSRSDYNNLEVKYWLVNGQRVDRLDEIVVTEDVRIEPFVQYKETQTYKRDGYGLYLGWICNAEDVLTLDDNSGEELVVSLYDLAHMLADPRCVIPSSIYVGKNYKTQTMLSDNQQSYLPFLLRYLQEGGKLIIDDENPNMSFIGGKSFCNAQGTELYYYFEGEGETEVVLHPQIEKIYNQNAFWNGENYVKLNLTNVKELNQFVGDSLPNLQEINLGKELVKITGYSAKDTVNNFLNRIPRLTKVEVSENHATLRAQNSFVYEESARSKELLYAPKALTGEISVPDGITVLHSDCFNGSAITHLIFPDSLKQMEMSALTGMSSLEKITFGASEELLFLSKAELPALTSVVFNGTKNIEGSYSNFVYANVDTIEIPKELESFENIFVDCKAYKVAEENAVWKSVDGVLYNKQENRLAMYPKNKSGDSYSVLDGTVDVGVYSFFESSLKTVIFPESCTWVYGYAFQNSQIESAQFKAKDEIVLDYNAFYFCEQLSNIAVEESVELTIKSNVFTGCKNLKTFPYQNVVYIENEVFDRAGIEYFELSENLKYLGNSVFEESQLKTVVFKTTELESIPYRAFVNTPLESITLSESITYIYAEAFAGCKSLKTIDLKNVTSIGASAFEGSGLESVASEAVSVIYEYAFADCDDLENAAFTNLPTLPSGAFTRSGLKIASLPLVKIVELYAFAECNQLVYVLLADGVSLGFASFMNCALIEELPFTVSSVATQAFSGCTSLKEITIDGKALAGTQLYVFENCTSLEEVVIVGESVELGEGFFSGCTALKKVFITHMGMSNGMISSNTFDLSSSAEVYLNVPETFLWKGKIPTQITVYVPVEYVDTFKSEWLVEENQIQGYDFSGEGNE